jgi:hypothetical protein
MSKDKTLLSKKELEAVATDDLLLNEEFIRMAGDMAHHNRRYTDANREFLLEKHESSIVEAKARLRIRTETLTDKPKPTDNDLKAMVTVDSEVQQANLRRVEAEAEKEKLKRFAEAVVAKKDMIQSLGAKVREEMRGDPAIRDLHRESKISE